MRNHQKRWQNKALHGQYLNDTDGKTDCEITSNWRKNGYLKKETLEFIMAAQDQAIRTNAIKARIDKTSSDSKCRLCMVKKETINHLVSSCSKIAQTDNKERHDKVASMLLWNSCRKYNLRTADNSGSIKSITFCKRRTLRFSGTSRYRRTCTWHTTYQTSLWFRRSGYG